MPLPAPRDQQRIDDEFQPGRVLRYLRMQYATSKQYKYSELDENRWEAICLHIRF